jgi:hypothetical protein
MGIRARSRLASLPNRPVHDMERTLSVAAILDRLGHEILLLKKLGAFEQAAGVQAAVVQILRLADETPQSLEPT